MQVYLLKSFVAVKALLIQRCQLFVLKNLRTDRIWGLNSRKFPGRACPLTTLVACALHAVPHGFQKCSVPMLCPGTVCVLATPLHALSSNCADYTKLKNHNRKLELAWLRCKMPENHTWYVCLHIKVTRAANSTTWNLCVRVQVLLTSFLQSVLIHFLKTELFFMIKYMYLDDYTSANSKNVVLERGADTWVNSTLSH